MSVVGSISIKDNVTAILKRIKKEQAAFRSDVVKTKNELKATWNQVYTAKIRAKDAATAQITKVGNVLKTIEKKVVMPVIRIKDAATARIAKVKKELKSIGKKAVMPIIRIKDAASAGIKKVGNALKSIGKKVFAPVIRAKDAASKVIGAVSSKVKKLGSIIAKPVVALKDAATAKISSIKNMLSKLAKGVTIAVSVAGIGMSAVFGGAISGGAALEQSIGGVETLFKDSSGVVKANADKAFRTAGLSANEYMETVTGFSASLLQSLGGDTAKAAEMADMAIIDMSDNANKMGTDMESIQNAYGGFAKQNYTMLDNLKLGYGGTKEEMQRLLSDAQKLTGVKYDISSLADIYSAIHVIQQDLDITGTTAKEASETFSGSFAAMKSSVKNLLGNMAIGGDVKAAMQETVETAFTFLFDNALPMIGNVCAALPDVVGTAIRAAGPKLKEIGGKAVGYIRTGLNEMFPTSMGGLGDIFFDSIDGAVSALAPIAEHLKGMFSGAGSAVAETLAKALANGSAFIQGFADVALPVLQTFTGVVQTLFPLVSDVIAMALDAVMPVVGAFSELIQSALPVVTNVIQIFRDAVASALPVVKTIFQGLGTKIAQVVNVVTEHMGLLQGVFETVSPILQSAIQIVSSVLQTAWSTVSPIIDLAISVFDLLLDCVEAVFPKIQSIISKVWDVLEPIFGGIADGIGVIGNAVNNVTEFVGGKVNAVTDWVKSKAGGKSGAKTGGKTTVGKNAKGDNNWRGGLTWVGEEGAELVDLPRGSRILPHKESMFAAGALSGAFGTVQSTTSQVVRHVVSGSAGDGSDGIIEPVYGILDILRQVLELLKGRQSGKQETTPGASGGQKASGVQVIVQKLADQITVREDEDIDEIADKVAKRVLEVVLNMS